MPTVRVIREAELLARMADEVATDQELAMAERWYRGLALYELASTNQSPDERRREAVDETAAVYVPDDNEVIVVDRGQPLDDESAVELFAHEMVHAFQHAEHDLPAYKRKWATSYDALLALHALLEGEALLYQSLVALQLRGASFSDFDWASFYRDLEGDTQEQAERDESPIAMASMRFPYAYGGALLTRYYTARGPAGIKALWKDPPRSTWEVVFGPSNRDLGMERDAIASRAVPELSAPFQELGATSLGAWIERIFAARRGVPDQRRWDPPQATASDVFSVHVDEETDSVIASWRMRMFEGSQPSVWPNIGLGKLDGNIDRAEHELFIVASERDLPVTSTELSWRAAGSERGGEPRDEHVSSNLLTRDDWHHCGRGLQMRFGP